MQNQKKKTQTKKNQQNTNTVFLFPETSYFQRAEQGNIAGLQLMGLAHLFSTGGTQSTSSARWTEGEHVPWKLLKRNCQLIFKNLSRHCW